MNLDWKPINEVEADPSADMQERPIYLAWNSFWDHYLVVYFGGHDFGRDDWAGRQMWTEISTLTPCLAYGGDPELLALLPKRLLEEQENNDE